MQQPHQRVARLVLLAVEAVREQREAAHHEGEPQHEVLGVVVLAELVSSSCDEVSVALSSSGTGSSELGESFVRSKVPEEEAATCAPRSSASVTVSPTFLRVTRYVWLRGRER